MMPWSWGVRDDVPDVGASGMSLFRIILGELAKEVVRNAARQAEQRRQAQRDMSRPGRPDESPKPELPKAFPSIPNVLTGSGTPRPDSPWASPPAAQIEEQNIPAAQTQPQPTPIIWQPASRPTTTPHPQSEPEPESRPQPMAAAASASAPKPMQSAAELDERNEDELLSDADLLERMEQAGRIERDDGLHLKHVYPPVLPMRSKSFLGGLPIVPPGFVWPRTRDQGKALTFLGQINCADMPEFEHRSLFPADGVIYFFIDWTSGGVGEFDGDPVLYIPASDEVWSEAQAPADLPCINVDGRTYKSHLYARPSGVDDMTYWSVYPKVEIELGRVREVIDREVSTPRQRKLAEAAALDSLTPFHGPALGDKDVVGAGWAKSREIGPPYPGFPRNWLAVEMTAGLLANKCRGAIETVEYCLRQPDANTFQQRHEVVAETVLKASHGIIGECDELMEHARQMGRMNAVSDEDKAVYWRWLGDVIPRAAGRVKTYRKDELTSGRIEDCIRAAAIHSADAALKHSAETAAQFADQVEALMPLHSVMHRYRYTHKIGGIPRDAQDATSEYVDSHVLLMQFDVDRGMDWCWGDCGVMQFWLTPDDLLARRFDRAGVSFSSS